MTEYNRYAEYKDSGNELLGYIPMEWNTLALKKHLSRNDGGAWGNDNAPGRETYVLRSTEQTQDGEWKKTEPAKRYLTDREFKATKLEKNDLLVTKSSGSKSHIGKTTIVDDIIASLQPGYSNFMQRLRVDKTTDARFIWYQLLSPFVRTQMNLVSNATIGLGNLNASNLANLVFIFPPLKTQHAIVKFLDSETAHIDAGITNMESLITLLAEKRTALISEVVTRGIPGEHTEFKDSGVAWLGEIPTEWEATDPKNLFVAKSMQSLPEDAHLMASQKYGVIPQADYLKNTGKRVVEVFSQDARFKHIDKDDFLIHLRSFQGGIEHCVNTGKVTTAYTVISPTLQKIFPLYAKYLLKSKDYISGLASTTNQLRDGQSIKWKDFRKVILPVPPIDEQKKIASFLEQELAGIELIAHEASTTIELLKEKRQTLISDVVTGKIDVTNSTK